jgi:hypothetical protein
LVLAPTTGTDYIIENTVKRLFQSSDFKVSWFIIYLITIPHTRKKPLLLVCTQKSGLELNAEKTKYVFMFVKRKQKKITTER